MSDILIGVGTPQANPTVETEFRRYLNSPAQMVTTRLTSQHAQYTDRLVDYIEQLPQAIRSFGGMPIRAFGFACTGSSYLVGAQREDELRESTERDCRVQIVTATQAIRRELEGRGARRIAMLAPYPEALCDAAVAYWASLGFEIVTLKRILAGDDTQHIYDIDPQQVQSAITEIDIGDADVVLLSGTGLPTIAALQEAPQTMISSNLCLATELLRRTQLWPPLDAADAQRLTGSE